MLVYNDLIRVLICKKLTKFISTGLRSIVFYCWNYQIFIMVSDHYFIFMDMDKCELLTMIFEIIKYRKDKLLNSSVNLGFKNIVN